MQDRLSVRSEATVIAALLHHGLEAGSRDTALACVQALEELELVAPARVLALAVRDTDAAALAPAGPPATVYDLPIAEWALRGDQADQERQGGDEL